MCMHPYIVHCILVYVHIRDQFLWDNVLCNCIVVATVIVIHIMMYCDVTSGFCTYILCVPVDVIILFESWPKVQILQQCLTCHMH